MTVKNYYATLKHIQLSNDFFGRIDLNCSHLQIFCIGAFQGQWQHLANWIFLGVTADDEDAL
jgi:hypothetical protein